MVPLLLATNETNHKDIRKYSKYLGVHPSWQVANKPHSITGPCPTNDWVISLLWSYDPLTNWDAYPSSEIQWRHRVLFLSSRNSVPNRRLQRQNHLFSPFLIFSQNNSMEWTELPTNPIRTDTPVHNWSQPDFVPVCPSNRAPTCDVSLLNALTASACWTSIRPRWDPELLEFRWGLMTAVLREDNDLAGLRHLPWRGKACPHG